MTDEEVFYDCYDSILKIPHERSKRISRIKASLAKSAEEQKLKVENLQELCNQRAETINKQAQQISDYEKFFRKLFEEVSAVTEKLQRELPELKTLEKICAESAETIEKQDQQILYYRRNCREVVAHNQKLRH